MTNPRDSQTVTATVIPSQWGQDVNDRVVQVFTNKAALVPIAGYTPQIGSLAYTEVEKGLWRYVAPGVWESAVARGVLLPVNGTGHVAVAEKAVSQYGVWTELHKANIGSVRQGCTYMVGWQTNPYTPSGNLGLWQGQIYLRDVATGVTLANAVKVGGGWPGALFGSKSQGGVVALGRMGSHYSSVEVLWRVQLYPTVTVPVTFTDNYISVTEVGGPS